MKIKQLPENVINKIAAGEVIERPANVLKELIENSLDAGANKIEVFIEKGGKRLIKVKDNGTGIEPDDIPKAVKRFTTSKIFSEDDLFNLETYGFRGEALASISAVSKFKLISRTLGNPVGYELYIEGGNIKHFKETGCGIGTSVIVEDLFFNIPARQKFLKSDRTELIHILDVFSKYAFLHTDKYLSITVDGKQLYNFYPSTLKDRVLNIIGKENEKDLIEIEYEGNIGTIKGLISTSSYITKKKYIFINGRPVRNWLIQNTIKSIIGDNFYILFFQFPSYFVDFNVHPAKEEVKFVKESSVVSLIKGALNENLNKFKSISYQFKKEETDQLKQKTATYNAKKNFEIIGQIEDTFLIAYFNGEVYFIDQHVAHERIFYEMLMEEFLEKGNIPSQRLIIPSKLSFAPDEIQRLNILKDKLKNIGFEFDIEENIVLLKAIPYNLKQNEAENALREILETGNLNISFEEIFSNIACKMSVKAGDRLNEEKAYSLLENWLKTNNPNLCPHGRPIYYKISLDEIKKYVGRK
ncbi:DNA mismatch repair endonuclease MutL [Hydrogenothermus marinus]|uniref:DNA mismatch repair protein MutL n=1 Tax=Hydrogenothermus marinus TaxID=133270 RepID=A0A3M0BNS1_9AQUI|nr:DNA mismatch repair endonuclease MutL [Hydrogenothermus marinus]RMA97939.1 DNA mismatch repair protein MutL [Hydrogenothermus marinus]